MRRLLVFGLAALLAAAFAQSARGVVPAKTVRSADGLLTVKVPRGALTTNVRMRIRVVRAAKFPELRRFVARAPLAGKVYELLPHGLRFSKPVEIIQRVTRPGGFDVEDGVPGMVLAYRNARGKWVRLGAQENGLAATALEASALTRHFSAFATFKVSVGVSMDPSRVDKAVGETWRPKFFAGGTEQTAFPWYSSGVVWTAPNQQFPDPDHPFVHFLCGSAGTGTYGAVVRTRVSLPRALFARPYGATIEVTLTGFANCRVPVAHCEEGPRAGLITKNGQPYIQVSALCAGLAAVLDSVSLGVPDGKVVWAWDAHSPLCSATTVSLECKVKADGRICMHVSTNPPSLEGDIVRIQIIRGDRSFLIDETGVIRYSTESDPFADCAIGG